MSENIKKMKVTKELLNLLKIIKFNWNCFDCTYNYHAGHFGWSCKKNALFHDPRICDDVKFKKKVEKIIEERLKKIKELLEKINNKLEL